jgi:hypothetical protein
MGKLGHEDWEIVELGIFMLGMMIFIVVDWLSSRRRR